MAAENRIVCLDTKIFAINNPPIVYVEARIALYTVNTSKWSLGLVLITRAWFQAT